MIQGIPSVRDLNKLVQKPNYKTAGNWMVRTFLRDASVPCTWLCLKAGISADQITVLAILAGLIAGAFLSFTENISFLAGALLLQLWYYLDHVDGQIARFHGKASLTGRFFDFVMHHLIHGWIYFCLPAYLLWTGAYVYVFYLCGLASISIMLFNLQHDAKYKTFFEALEKNPSLRRRPAGNTETAEKSAPSIPHRIFSLLHKLNEVHVVMNILTTAAILEFFIPGDALRRFLCWFYLLSPVLLCLVKFAHIIRRKTVDEEFNLSFNSD